MQVIDSGPGIPLELQPRIFERFARGDSSRSRAAGSTGLGLSIVHAVVTAHRGSVSVQSVPGQTVFTVVLPLMPPHHSPNAGYGGPATGTYPVSPTGQFAQIAPGRR
jgi:two-component system OmpR family sensor kinase